MLRMAWLALALFLATASGCSGDKGGPGASSGNGNGPGGSNGGPGPTSATSAGGADGGGSSTGFSTGGSNAGSGGTSSDTSGANGGTVGGSVTGGPPPTATDFHADHTSESGLDQGTIDTLKGGGSECTTPMIYPYADTVFPGALVSPLIMWHGASEASYVKLSYAGQTLLDYQFAAAASNPGEMRIPQADWDEITRRTQGTPLEITFTTISGGAVSTCQTQWKIARGNMTGSIYYNTYNHPDTGGQGAVMRLRLGQAQSDVYLSYQGVSIPALGPCKSCHSVSFDGSTLVSSQHDYTTKTWLTESFDIGDAPQPPATTSLENATFGALTPNGDFILSMGNPQCTAGADSFPRASNNFPLVEGPARAHLVDTTSGAEVEASGLNPDWYMWMAQFSPNGDRIVFNHAKPAGGITDRRELAWMTYDPATHAFGEPTLLVSNQGPEPSLPYSPLPATGGIVGAGLGGCTEGLENTLGLPGIPGIPGNTAALPQGSCEGPCYPAWPFFTPDGNGVIYALINEPDFAAAIPGRDAFSQSELWYVDVRTGEQVRLDKANAGLAPGDSLANYYPTVLPVQVGGYFWVFWSTTRDWGHRDLSALSIGTSLAAFNASRKRIWVTAIAPRVASDEFGLAELTDPSAPGFYLEGQSGTGNARAFAALNPCVAEGNECTSGLDCCTGFCEIERGASVGQCVPEAPRCALLNEKCEEDADCCLPDEDDDPSNDMDPPNVCLGGYCGFVIIQ